MFVYVVGYESDSIAIVDVSTDLAHPAVIGSITGDTTHLHGAGAVTVSSKRGYVYVASWVGGSSAVNVSVPTNPVVLSTVTGTNVVAQSYAVASDDKYAYVAGYNSDSLTIVDFLSDKDQPAVVGHVRNSTWMRRPLGVAIAPNGTFAFVSGYESHSLAVVDVQTDSASPKVVAFVNDSMYMRFLSGVATAPDGRHAYVACGGLAVIDVTNPQRPILVGHNHDSSMTHAPALAVSPCGRFVYVVGEGVDSIVAINVTDPRNPTVFGSLIDSIHIDRPRGVAVSPDGVNVFVVGWNSDSFAACQVLNC